MSYLLPHLHSGWAVDQAILAEEERLVIIRFGHDWDETCMQVDGAIGVVRAYLNRDMSARFARLCLPPGATADHPFLNPFGPGAPALDGVALAPTLVVVAGDDILRDRNVEFVRRMKGVGEARGGLGVPRAGARLLLAPGVEQARGRAGPCLQAVHGRGLPAPGFD
ncbi:putative carboxylesterase 15 [Panicum miliaceum]|uniref:Carboxylesterase 15 n=1 Tax=Panicum miliaceum TaxID=4540 RepID=A0A3L6RL95_PANMI|nr:putative carboxylesterase 15 [Panicum miliaceum]